MTNTIPSLFNALTVLTKIGEAYFENNLNDEARRFWGENDENVNQTPSAMLELYSGRGGKQLLTLQDCFFAKAAQESGDTRMMEEAIEPLVTIARAWDANELDDEARKFWGVSLENRNTTDPKDIDLVSGRGGVPFLTLQDALDGRAARNQFRHAA